MNGYLQICKLEMFKSYHRTVLIGISIEGGGGGGGGGGGVSR